MLLTDGVTYVRGVAPAAYRTNLRTFVTSHLSGAGITIDVLLLDSRKTAMWTELARVAPAGSAPDEFLPRAHGVIARLAGTRTAESAPAKTNPAIDTLVVPPYLEIIVFAPLAQTDSVPGLRGFEPPNVVLATGLKLLPNCRGGEERCGCFLQHLNRCQANRRLGVRVLSPQPWSRSPHGEIEAEPPVTSDIICRR